MNTHSYFNLRLLSLIACLCLLISCISALFKSIEVHVCFVMCRACAPVTALCFNGAQPDASDRQPPAARLLLLSGADLHRWILLQAAHQERRVQESGRRGSHAGVCWRRGHELHHGEGRSSSGPALCSCFSFTI